MRTKGEMLRDLETMLREVFEARFQGGDHARLSRSHGYVDGYMRALLEAEIATRQELLTIVATQRAIVSGPAVGEMHLDEIDSAAA